MNEVSTTEKWYTSKEMCEMNKVSDRTLESFNAILTSESDCTTQLIKKCGYHNSQNFYSEEALQRFQLWLLKNQANQGRASDVVKQNTENLLEVGALTTCVQNNGDIAAAQQFCKLLMANTAAVAESKKLALENARQQNQLIEQKPKVEYYDNLCDASNLIAIGSVGKQIGIGAQKIFKVLQDDRIIYRKIDGNKNGYFVLYYEYEKYFQLIQTSYHNEKEDKEFSCYTLKVNQKGVMWLTRRYSKNLIKEDF